MKIMIGLFFFGFALLSCIQKKGSSSASSHLSRAGSCPTVIAPYSKSSANYDEALVPKFTLPSLLINNDGTKVLNESDWRKRRLEILKMYNDEVYGSVPQNDIKVTYTKSPSVVPIPTSLQNLNPQIDEIIMNFSKDGMIKKTVKFIIAIPAIAKTTPVSAMLFLNFANNTEALDAWPTKDILANNQAIIYVQYTDIEPDSNDDFRFSAGIRKLFLNPNENSLKENEWGAISAWAYGSSRILDYLISSVPRINSKKIAIAGHSRLGKTALWAAAQDERFAMAISNNSGEMGTAISRRKYGETVHAINYYFPHWFNCNFKKYINAEDTLPIDQHMLIALIAPRPVYVASATEDKWADPKGEFLGLKGANEVYKLLGLKGIDENIEDVSVDIPVGNLLRYHIRTGIHQVTSFDWTEYLRFMKEYF